MFVYIDICFNNFDGHNLGIENFYSSQFMFFSLSQIRFKVFL